MAPIPLYLRSASLAACVSLATTAWTAPNGVPPAIPVRVPSVQSGSISGTVQDADFEAPLAGARVEIIETGQATETDARGGYSFGEVAPGTYTVIVSKGGYTRAVQLNVLVTAGEVTDVDAALTGEFTDMDELVVEEVELIGGATELGLLNLRFEAPSLIDSIGVGLISRAGIGDAAGALRRISGATVADDSTAVVRGLPDRYVSSQVNGVRLPSANEDKRAVELDQFPSAVIESVQVSKTFTPDQQGDASGGAVNVVLQSIPDEPIFRISAQSSYNTQVTNDRRFLSYDGGGVGTLGKEGDTRPIQFDNLGQNWDGAVGVDEIGAPRDWKVNGAIGGSHELENGWRLGGFVSLFYERDSSLYRNGRNDSWWQATPGGPLVPQIRGQGSVSDGDFQTALFDVERGSRFVQWGTSAAVGLETDDHSIALNYLYSHTAEDVAILAEDTRGKEFFFPGYDPDDPRAPGNLATGNDLTTAPYLRTETLEYTERTIGTLQLVGSHRFPMSPIDLGAGISLRSPKIDWIAASSFSRSNQPDKRLFGGIYRPDSYDPGNPVFGVPAQVNPGFWEPFRPADNINLGNLQRIFKRIEEDGTQGAVDFELPFRQWDDEKGSFRVGLFEDRVDRTFEQQSYTNDNSFFQFFGDFSDFWSQSWNSEDHPIVAAETDVDYFGEVDISAYYGMFDMPLSESFKLIGGARVESTDISVVLDPEDEVLWTPPGQTNQSPLAPGDGDVALSQRNVLPSLSAIYEISDDWTLRGAVSRTIARQTFKELTPIVQQEFLGGPVFIGNPELQIAELTNYDLRLDYRPSDGTLVSLSYFHKDLTNPIENIQRVVNFGFTFPVNYPDGRLSGIELEARQQLGELWSRLDGLAVGANATFIDSKVNLPDEEIALLSDPSVDVDLTSRDATNAPEHLYNLFLTYDVPDTGTQFGLFYTVQGDTLIAGDSTSEGNYIPAIYRKEFGTLNFSIGQRLGRFFNLRVQAKNLTNPLIEEVFRSDFTGPDVTNTSFSRGIEYSVTLGANFQI